MRFVETSKGTFEMVEDVNGNAVAVNLDDFNFAIPFGRPSADVDDEEVVASVER